MATDLRRKIVDLRIRGLSTRAIAIAVGRSQSTVRYHLWHDATDPEDRTGGYYGKTDRKRERRRRERHSTATC